LTPRRDGVEAVVSVRDDGIGLTPEQLPCLFEMFSQIERGTARAQGGLGSGLSLARQLVQMHGGTIIAESEGAGCGSCFTVRLPIAAEEDVALQAGSGAAAPPRLALQRLLVVDDNRDAADSLALLLENLGAQVHVAHDGAAALDAFERFAPRFVLLDIGMPGMNGLEVARRLREKANGHDVTLVALTGWGQPDDRERTRAAGFDHHLVKPVDMALLLALLGGAVR
jgi:CheY-like chemotaxis protein